MKPELRLVDSPISSNVLYIQRLVGLGISDAIQQYWMSTVFRGGLFRRKPPPRSSLRSWKKPWGYKQARTSAGTSKSFSTLSGTKIWLGEFLDEWNFLKDVGFGGIVGWCFVCFLKFLSKKVCCHITSVFFFELDSQRKVCCFLRGDLG